MDYTKLIFLMGTLFLCVAPVMGWTVDAPGHKGTVEFNADNTGHLNVDGYSLNFNWVQIGETNQFKSSYLWYSVNFELNDGVITSPQFPGARLVR